MILRIDRRLLQNVDWPLIVAAVALICLSFVSLWSLAPTGGIAWRQLVWVGVGTGALLVVIALDYRNLVRAAPGFYVIGVGLLLTVFILGRTVSGARRWIHLGPFTFQPSELFKLIFVLTLAWALTSRWGRPLSRATLIWTGILVGVPFVLVVRQPDLGTAVLITLTGATVMILAGLNWKIIAGAAAAAAVAVPLAFEFVLHDYQRQRILTFLNPEGDPSGTG